MYGFAEMKSFPVKCSACKQVVQFDRLSRKVWVCPVEFKSGISCSCRVTVELPEDAQ